MRLLFVLVGLSLTGNYVIGRVLRKKTIDEAWKSAIMVTLLWIAILTFILVGTR